MKRFIKYLAFIICIFSLVGCGAAKLSDTYSEDKLKAASEEVIKNLNEENYSAIINGFGDELKSKLTEDKLREPWKAMKDKLGKYDSISKIAFQEKDGIATVVAICKYENGKAQFTLSFNKDMKMVGIYMK